MKKSNFSVSELLSMVVNVFDTIEACRKFASCQFGHGFVARSDPKFRAPKTTAIEWVSEFGCPMPKVVKVTKVTNARVYDYQGSINRELSKQGSSESFVSDGLNGYEWVVPNIIKRANKDGELQLTLTFKSGDKTKFETFYIVGNHFATESELRFIKEHLYVAPNKSLKQSEMGISDENILMVRNYKFSNVMFVGKTNQIEEFWSNIK